MSDHIVTRVNNTNELYHYGVIGMKWGVRHNAAKADKLQAKATKKKYGLFTNAKKAAELQVKADRAQYKADKIKGRAEKRKFKESNAKGQYVRAQRKAERWVKQMDKTFQSYDVSKLSAQNVAVGELYIKKIA